MPNTIIIVHGGDVGRPEAGSQRILAFAKSLLDAGYKVLIVTAGRGKSTFEATKGIRIYRVPIPPQGVYNQLLRGVAVLSAARILMQRYRGILHIVHSSLAGLASIMGMRDYVLDMHDLAFADPQYNTKYVDFSKYVYTVEKMGITNARKIIVVSHYMREFLIKEWGVEREKIEVIPNGYWENIIKNIDTDNIEEKNYVVRVGSLFIHLNIEAIVKLAKALKGFANLILVGDGELRNRIENVLHKESINNVIITGYLPYEKAMKIALQAKAVFEIMRRSLTEFVSWPVKIMDYAALGKAMALGCSNEVCQELKKVGGALVSAPEDVDLLVDNVLNILVNEKLRRSLKQRAKEFAREYSWEKLGQKLVKIYDEMLYR